MAYTGKIKSFFDITGTLPEQWVPGDFRYFLSPELELQLDSERPSGGINVASLFEGLNPPSVARCQLCSAHVRDKFTVRARLRQLPLAQLTEEARAELSRHQDKSSEELTIWAYVGSDCIAHFFDPAFEKAVVNARKKIKEERRLCLIAMQDNQLSSLFASIMEKVGEQLKNGWTLKPEAADQLLALARRMFRTLSESVDNRKGTLAALDFTSDMAAVQEQLDQAANWGRAALEEQELLQLFTPHSGAVFTLLSRVGGCFFASVGSLALYTHLPKEAREQLVTRVMAQQAKKILEASSAHLGRLTSAAPTLRSASGASKMMLSRLQNILYIDSVARHLEFEPDEAASLLFSLPGVKKTIEEALKRVLAASLEQIKKAGLPSFVRELSLKDRQYSFLQKEEASVRQELERATHQVWEVFLAKLEAAVSREAGELRQLVSWLSEDHQFEFLATQALSSSKANSASSAKAAPGSALELALAPYGAGALLFQLVVTSLRAGPILEAMQPPPDAHSHGNAQAAPGHLQVSQPQPLGAGQNHAQASNRADYQLQLARYEALVRTGELPPPTPVSFSEYGFKVKQYYLKNANLGALSDRLMDMGFKKNRNTGGLFHTDKEFVDFFSQKINELSKSL